jgi:hypothetical protein
MSTELKSKRKEYKIIHEDLPEALNKNGIKDYWYIQSKPIVKETVFFRITKDVGAYFIFLLSYLSLILINFKTINDSFKKYSETPDAKIDGIIPFLIVLFFFLFLLLIVIYKSGRITKINNDWSDFLNYTGVVDHFYSEQEAKDAVNKLIINDDFYNHIKGTHVSLNS